MSRISLRSWLVVSQSSICLAWIVASASWSASVPTLTGTISTDMGKVLGGGLGIGCSEAKIEEGRSLVTSGSDGHQGTSPALLKPFLIRPGLFLRQFSVAFCNRTTMEYLFTVFPALIVSHCQDHTSDLSSALREEKNVKSNG